MTRRLSLLRLAGVVAVVAATAASGYAAVARVLATPAQPAPAWFAPYVDVTLPPSFQFQNRGASSARDVVLGFVVADPNEPCTPSWGAHYTLAAASTGIDLDRRIVRFRRQGGDVIVSFGGQRNSELAVACQEVTALADAYRSAIARYGLTTVDFDVEGSALGDADANLRRAEAIARVQNGIRKHGGKLAIWLTLPAETTGLSTEAVSALDSMLAAHVDLAGVNVMTMDFGSSLASGETMVAAVERSLGGAHRQLVSAYRRAGINLSLQHAWNKIGATPMIGQNDVAGERFDLGAASALLAFVGKHHLLRVSIWSANRDSPCGPNVADLTVVSNFCSGVDEPRLGFTRTFAALTGRPATTAGSVTVADRVVRDDPAASPYPIWALGKGYVEGFKVVWHGNVYRAKWWSEGQAPDAPIVHDWETPWVLVGPVLPGEHPAKAVAVVKGKFPAWSPEATYLKGDKVLFGGLPYQAKWWTHGDKPDAHVSTPWNTPWRPLFSMPGEPLAISSG
jgi:chitinase